MNVKNPNEYATELGSYISKFEKRLKESGHFGLTLHTGVTRRIFNDLKEANNSKDKVIYSELMQLEEAIKKIAKKRSKEFPAMENPATEDQNEVSDESLKILDQIYKLKGLVGLCCLAFISLSILPGTGMRRPSSGRMKIQETGVEVQTWN